MELSSLIAPNLPSFPQWQWAVGDNYSGTSIDFGTETYTVVFMQQTKISAGGGNFISCTPPTKNPTCPLKRVEIFNRKPKSSNHHFSGANSLVFGGRKKLVLGINQPLVGIQNFSKSTFVWFTSFTLRISKKTPNKTHLRLHHIKG